MSIKIIADSTCDISLSQARELDVEIVPLKIIIEGKEYTDGIDITKEEFMDKLLVCEKPPTTVQVNPEAFTKVFKKHINNGDEIIGVFISSTISGTCQSANIAKENAGSNDIHIIDSTKVSIACGALIYEACKLRDEGKSAVEIAKLLNKLKEKIRFFCVIDTLKYLKLGGRMSATTAILGSILNVKPIISMIDGQISSIGKARGLSAAYKHVTDIISKTNPDFSKTCVFGRTSDLGTNNDFRQFISQRIDFKEINDNIVGTVVSTHSGPNCVGIAFFDNNEDFSY